MKLSILVLLCLVAVLLTVATKNNARRNKKFKMCTRKSKSKMCKKKTNRQKFIVGGGTVYNASTIIRQYRAACWVEDLNQPEEVSDRLICGCTWVSRNFVLTVRSCFDHVDTEEKMQNIRVHLRDWDRFSPDDQPCEHTSRVTQKWQDESDPPAHNLVILKLESHHTEQDCWTPVLMDCQQAAWQNEGGTKKERIAADVTGWGVTSVPGSRPNLLRFTTVHATQDAPPECKDAFSDGVVKDTHLCARKRGNGDYQGPCFGDGGSPLLEKRYGGRLIGIVSYLPKGCTSNATWSVYISIATVCDYIFNIIGCNMADVGSWTQWIDKSTPNRNNKQDNEAIGCEDHPCVGDDPICWQARIKGKNRCNRGCKTLTKLRNAGMLDPYGRKSGLVCHDLPARKRNCRRCCDLETRYLCYNGPGTMLTCPPQPAE